MKKQPGLLLLLLLTVTLTSATVHKFYVAVFQCEYAIKKKEIRITGRIFIDDLEKVLDTKYGKKLYIGSPREDAGLNDILKQYFADKITVKINGTEKPVKFLAKEIEDDVLICYFTVACDKKPASMQMRNTILMDMFREQQNIVHTNINNERKSLLLTYDTPQGTLEF